mmetsp:Transcript_27936/g.75956  ORF Transcript_27936/g.75956 Transcript_27936/m.75956 type:complete len:329 (+) Transcript_27936:479-1465(+)
MGFNQMLPYRDRSGRPVFANVGTMGFNLDLKTRLRGLIYIHFVVSNDLESQRKGMVLLAMPEGDFSETPLPLFKDSRRLLSITFASTPIRIAAIHICFPDTLYFRLIRSFLVLSVPFRNHRLKAHTGTTIERRYTIQGYGIPVEMIPLTDSGNVKRTYLYQWIRVRKLIEQEQTCSKDSIILMPRSNDVLFRSGTTTMAHPGNVFFRSLIELKHHEFRSGSGFTQAILAEDIVKVIERLDGRFLKWHNQGYWTELKDRGQILFKTEVSIRDFKSRIKATKNRQNSHSVTCSFERQDGSKRKRRKKSSDRSALGDSLAEAESTLCAFAC